MSNKMRVIIETQSNPLFLGQEAEQAYDQRGGLCEVGAGNLVVTTHPYDPDYMQYWRGLGFSLPHFVTAGPYDPNLTISDLIANKPQVQAEIKRLVNGNAARIEPFWVEERDLVLSRVLDIPMYSNIILNSRLASRHEFKQMCVRIGLQTPPWVGGVCRDEIVGRYSECAFAHEPVLAKSSNCTGGISLGMMKRFASISDLKINQCQLEELRFPLVIEKILDDVTEAGVHWEIDEVGQPRLIGIFDQISKNYSYAGAAIPSRITSKARAQIESDLEALFWPELIRLGGLGYFCCDVLINKHGEVYWTDLNPRKGAILYIHHLVERLATEVFGLAISPWEVWHSHANLPGCGHSFSRIRDRLCHRLRPSLKEPFLVITNPGSIPFGGVDITGFSADSREEAEQLVRWAEAELASA